MIRGARVLVTGGAGTVGSTIADQLVARGAAEIVVLDNFVRGRRENLAWAEANGPVTVVEGDICDADLVRELCAASTCLPSGGDADHAVRRGAAPRARGACRRHLQRLRGGRRRGRAKVVAASSASVYGLAEDFPTAEHHHPYANDTLYGAAKAFNEGLLRSLHAMRGLDYVALRYFNVYGPRMDIHGVYTEVLVRWMERIEAGQPPLILGDGTQTMDFVYTEDIARANVLAAQSDVTDDVFNVASGVETSLHEFAAMLLRVMGSDLPVDHGPERAVTRCRGGWPTPRAHAIGWALRPRSTSRRA